MTDVEIVIPYRETDDYRARALRFVTERLGRLFPDWTLTTGSNNDGGTWRKGAAVAALAAGSTADVLVMHDADVIADEGTLRSAVEKVAAGDVAWAVPHMWVHRLDESSTDRAYQFPIIFPPMLRRLDRGSYRGIVGGGLVAVSRCVYLDTPIDPRFHTWGSEDEAWGWALGARHGPPWQSPDAGLWHLWHPHAARPITHPIDQPSAVLLDQYRRGRERPAQLDETVRVAREVAGLSSGACLDSSSDVPVG